MQNVLIVCHGNINRSPACAAFLKETCEFNVLSAGFVNPGKRAAKKMRIAMASFGLNLEAHRSQLITQQLVEWANTVILMDKGNLKRFTKLFPLHLDKVEMLGKFASPQLARIPDPNYSPIEDVVNVAQIIKQATTNWRKQC